MKFISVKNITGLVLSVMLLASCSVPQNIAYFQDAGYVNNTQKAPVQEIKIQKGDKLFIMVKAQGAPELNSMFSLWGGTGTAGSISATSNSPYGYTVDQQGDIDFPVIGKVHAVGLTRDNLEEKIKNTIERSGQAKDVAVVVTFLNLHFSVLGEVNGAGQYSIDRDKITILDAISMARDLTINGKRENVLVFREENGKQKVYNVNLTSAQEIMSSPAYYLQQNDIVYVEPNDMRKRQSTVNGNNVYSTGFWMSLASLVMSTLLFFKKW